jgi:hypothetical protein
MACLILCFRHTCFHDLYFDLKMVIYRPKQLWSNKYITSYSVVLDGITYTLLYCYQHNGMDSNEYNVKFGLGVVLSSPLYFRFFWLFLISYVYLANTEIHSQVSMYHIPYTFFVNAEISHTLYLSRKCRDIV